MIYIFGSDETGIHYLLDNVFILLNIITLFLIIIEKLATEKFVLNKSTAISLTLLCWVISQSILNTIYSGRLIIPSSLFLSLLTFIIIVAGVKTGREFNVAIWSFIVGAFFSAIIPLVLYPEVIGTRISEYQGVHYSGGLWNSVLKSFVSSGWLILALLQKYKKKKIVFVFGLTSFTVIWLGAFAGLSRSFLLLTIISIIVYLFSSKAIKKYIQFFLFSIIIILIILNFMPQAIKGILNRLDHTIGNTSDEPRLMIWAAYLENYREYFLVGAMGNFMDYGPNLYPHPPHSTYINYFVQYGVLGIITFLALLTNTFKNIFLIKRLDATQFSMLLAWFSAYIIQISISETGYADVSFYVGLAFVTIWKQFLVPEKELIDFEEQSSHTSHFKKY